MPKKFSVVWWNVILMSVLIKRLKKKIDKELDNNLYLTSKYKHADNANSYSEWHFTFWTGFYYQPVSDSKQFCNLHLHHLQLILLHQKELQKILSLIKDFKTHKLYNTNSYFNFIMQLLRKNKISKNAVSYCKNSNFSML